MNTVIFQRQEDHPGNPGWWRWSRPEFRIAEPNSNSSHQRWRYGSENEAVQEQASWDASHPNG